MAGKTLVFKVAHLQLIFLGTALANMWDNAASSPLTALYLSFHTADPGPGNDQTVNETTYGAYARISVPRDGTGWTIDSLTAIVRPTAVITGTTPSSGSGTITHVGIGKASSGAGYLFMSGTITPNIIITVGSPPTLLTTSQIAEI